MENGVTNSSGRRRRIFGFVLAFALVVLVSALAGVAVYSQTSSIGAGLVATLAERDFSAFIRLLDELAHDNEQSNKEKRQGTPPIVQSTVGFGRHPFSGALAFQLVQLKAGTAWTDPKGQAASIPAGATLDASPAALPLNAETKTWGNINAYLEGLLDWTHADVIVPAPFSELHRQYDNVLVQYFAGGGSLKPPNVGQTRVVAPLYKVSMPANTLTSLPLQSGLQKAFQRLSNLPYPKYKEYYFALFDRIGTRVVWQSLQGGLVERLTHIRTDRIVSPDEVKQQLTMSWYQGQAPGEWARSEPKFDRSIDWMRQTCKGGNSHAINCQDVTGDARNVLPDAFRQSLWAQPVAVQDWLLPVSRLAQNANLRSNLDAAIVDYLAREQTRFKAAP